jgi:hypothetical protein
METNNAQPADPQKNKVLEKLRTYSPTVEKLGKVTAAIGGMGVGEVSDKSKEFITAHPAEKYSAKFLIFATLFCLIGFGGCMSILFTWYTGSIAEGIIGGIIGGILFALFFFYRFFLGSGLKKK